MMENDMESEKSLTQNPEVVENEQPAYQVFISHVDEDLNIAKKLYSDLVKIGIRPWMWRMDSKPGMNIQAEINYAIKNSKYFIFLLSKHSVSQRGQVQKELKTALDLFDEFPVDDIFIIPIRIDAPHITDHRLEHIRPADFSKSYKEGFAEILRTLKRYNNTETIVPKMPTENYDSYKRDCDESSIAKSNFFNDKKRNHYLYKIHVFDKAVSLTRVVNGLEEKELNGKIQESHIEEIKELHKKAFHGEIKSFEIINLGNYLFEILFCGEFSNNANGQADFNDFYIQVTDDDLKIALNIELKINPDDELYDFPWEFIKQPHKITPLSTDPKVRFYRSITHSDQYSWKPIETAKPIRVFRIGSWANEKEYEFFKNCKVEINELIKNSNYKIKFIDYPYNSENESDEGFVSDINELMKGDFDIVHYIGHGKFFSENEKTITKISFRQFGTLNWMDSESFAELLSQCKPKIIFFQSCETGAKPSLTMTRALIRQNIPVIIAMQHEIEICKAYDFSLKFYDYLAEHGCMLKAVQKGRNKLREHAMTEDINRAFAAPVIFTRTSKGMLWNHLPKQDIHAGRIDAAHNYLREPTNQKMTNKGVNRHEQIGMVRNLLYSLQNNPEEAEKVVINWYGVTGIGKTCLGYMIKQLCERERIPFVRVDFDSERNPDALRYPVNPLSIFRYIYIELTKQRPEIFPLLSEAADERQVIATIEKNITTGLQNTPAVILFDTTEKVDKSTIFWVEKNILAPLCTSSRCLLIWTGRFPQEWRMPKIKQKSLDPEKLAFLNLQYTKEQVGPSGDWIYRLTFGYPLANEHIAMATKKQEPRDKKKLNPLLCNLIDTYILGDIPPNLKIACRMLTVLRQFDVLMIEKILVEFASDYFHEKTDFLNVFGELRSISLADYNSSLKGYSLDETIRRFLARYFQKAERKKSLEISKRAMQIYNEWIDLVPENRIVYFIEKLFHLININNIQKKSKKEIATICCDAIDQYIEKTSANLSTVNQLHEEIEHDTELQDISGPTVFRALIKAINSHKQKLDRSADQIGKSKGC